MDKIWILLSFILFIIPACMQLIKDQVGKFEKIMETDWKFSDLSKKGMKAAFLQYIDMACILLMSDHHPIIGIVAKEYLASLSDADYTLTWAPQAGVISRSADLGFTHSLYTLVLKDTSIRGT